MFNKLSNFFQTNDICDENDIMYIAKTKGTQITEFHLTDGRTITKYISLRDCKAELSSDIFYNITKGVLININHVKCINRRTYHMKDGKVFEGKLKGYKLHQSLKEKCGGTV